MEFRIFILKEKVKQGKAKVTHFYLSRGADLTIHHLFSINCRPQISRRPATRNLMRES
jgi:hypothetical protein